MSSQLNLKAQPKLKNPFAPCFEELHAYYLLDIIMDLNRIAVMIALCVKLKS